MELGWRVAHWPTAGVAAAGTAQGAVAAHCPERVGVICLRAPEPHESGRGGALPVSRGACTAQMVRPWRASRGGSGRRGAEGRDCADTQCGVTPGRCVGRRWGVAQLRAYQPYLTVLARSPICAYDQALCTLWHCLILWVRAHSAAQYHVPRCC